MLVLAVLAAFVALTGDDAAREPPGLRIGTSVADALRVRLQVGAGLGALTAASGDVWANDYGHGQLVRLDGRSGRVLARLRLARRFEMATDGRRMWALRWGGRLIRWPNGPLIRIDPERNRVAARIPLRRRSGEPLVGFGVLAAKDGAVWVWGPTCVLRLEPSSGRLVQELAFGGRGGELTGAILHDGGLLAVTADGRLVRFDRQGRIRRGPAQPALATAELLATVGGRALAAVDGTLIAADTATGRIAWLRPLGFRVATVVESGGVLLVHGAALGDAGDRLWAVGPATGRVLATTTVPSFGTTSMVAARGSLWFATSAGEVIVLPRLVTSLFLRRARSAAG